MSSIFIFFLLSHIIIFLKQFLCWSLPSTKYLTYNFKHVQTYIHTPTAPLVGHKVWSVKRSVYYSYAHIQCLHVYIVSIAFHSTWIYLHSTICSVACLVYTYSYWSVAVILCGKLPTHVNHSYKYICRRTWMANGVPYSSWILNEFLRIYIHFAISSAAIHAATFKSVYFDPIASHSPRG